MSTIKRLIEKRLENKEMNIYKLAKIIMEKRELKGSPSRLHSTIGKAKNEPEKSRLQTIIDIVEALGGKLTIQWDNEKESPRTVYLERNWEIIKEENYCKVINLD